MANMPLEQFIRAQRAELISRCSHRLLQRSPLLSTWPGEEHGVARLLDQIVEELHSPSATDAIAKSATAHGHALLLGGFSVAQVVFGYGDICQSITELAMERSAPINAEDFRTLNRCLDDAIASAVTEHTRDQSGVPGDGSQQLRNLATTALTAFEALQRGNVIGTLAGLHFSDGH